MIQFVIDWVGRQTGRLEKVEIDLYQQKEVGILSPSELGYRFQYDEFEKLLNAVGHWESIELFSARGRPISDLSDMLRGPDGGIDVVVRITTSTERGSRVVAGRLRKIIMTHAGGSG